MTIDFWRAIKSKSVLEFARETDSLGEFSVERGRVDFQGFGAEAIARKTGEILFTSPKWLERPYFVSGATMSLFSNSVTKNISVEETLWARDALADFDFVNSICVYVGILRHDGEDAGNLINLAEALFHSGNLRDALVVYRRLYERFSNAPAFSSASKISEMDAARLPPYISNDSRTRFREYTQELAALTDTIEGLSFEDVVEFWGQIYRPHKMISNVMDWDVNSSGMFGDPDHREGDDGDWSRGQQAISVHSRGRGFERSGYLYLALRHYFIAYDLKPKSSDVFRSLSRWLDVRERLVSEISELMERQN